MDLVSQRWLSFSLQEAYRHRYLKLFLVLLVCVIDIVIFIPSNENLIIYAAIPAAILSTFLAFWRPDCAFFLLMLIVGNTSFRIGDVKVSEIIGAALAISLGLRGKLANPFSMPTGIFYQLFTFVALLSLLFRPAFSSYMDVDLDRQAIYGIVQLGRLLTFFIMILVMYSMIRNMRYFIPAFHGILLHFMLHGIFTIIQAVVFFLSSRTVELGIIRWEGEIFPRFSGFVSEPAGLSQIMVIGIFTALYVMDLKLPRKLPFLSLPLTLIVCIISLLLTFSTYGTLCAIAGVGIYFFTNIRSMLRFIFNRTTFVLASIIMAFTVYNYENVIILISGMGTKILVDVAILFTKIESSTGVRSSFDAAYLLIFKAHPVLGVGLGQAGLYMHDALVELNTLDQVIVAMGYSTAAADETFRHGMNYYTLFLSETGIVGIFFYLVFLGSLFYILAIRSLPPALTLYRKYLLSMAFLFYVGIYMNNSFYMPYFSAYIAMIISLVPLSRVYEMQKSPSKSFAELEK